VQSIRPTPKPKEEGKSSKRSVKNRRDTKRSRPFNSTDYWINSLIDGGTPLKKRTYRMRKPKVKVKFQKWDLTNESWNLKRSPCLRRLTSSLNKVKHGKNPYFQFKDLLVSARVRSLGAYNRYKSILEGGFFVSAKPVGVWITPQIRKAKNLSFQDMEILISKLPFWATSYTPAQIARLLSLVRNQVSTKGKAKQCHQQRSMDYLRVPLSAPWCVLPRTNRHLLENS
jgi:hypothetical protein